MLKPVTNSAAGLPHRLMEDDVYNNMYIPKGSLVSLNDHPIIYLALLILINKIIGNIW
jgi:hypothetical protein